MLKSYKEIIGEITRDSNCNNIVLCNNIVEVDEDLFDNVKVGDLYEKPEDEEPKEFYSYYLLDINDSDIEYAKKHYNDIVVICYSNKLGLYVLCVDHIGTSWGSVKYEVEDF